MNRIHVRAADGLSVPREGSTHKIGAEPVMVPNTVYYRRRVRTGELVVVQLPAERAKE